MVWIALAVMLCITIAQHLGLTEAIAETLGKIARCPKCCTFWSVLLLELLLTRNVIIAAGLSIVMAYLSQWFGLVLMLMCDKYNEVWETIRRKRRSRSSRNQVRQ